MNICEDCLREKDSHLTHSFIIFDQMYYDLNIIIKNIKELLKINENNEANNEDSIKNNKSFDNISIEGENFIRLMSIIFNDYTIVQAINFFKIF